MVDTINKLDNSPIITNANNIDNNIDNIITEVQHDLGIFKNIAAQTFKLIGKIIPLVVSIESGNIIKGAQDGIKALQQLENGTKEVEKDLATLETPYLKDWGKLVAHELEKVTNIVDLVKEDFDKEAPELWNDLKTLNFAEFLKDVKELFENIHEEVGNVIEGIEKQPILELTGTLTESVAKVQTEVQQFQQKTETRQLMATQEKAPANTLEVKHAALSNIPGLAETVKAFKEVEAHFEPDTKNASQTANTLPGLNQNKPEHGR